MNYKKRNNEFGFTLVEIMVAAGLLGVLSVALVNMIGNINRTSKRASQVFSIEQETRRIVETLTDKDACTNSLQGLDIGSAPDFTATVNVASIQNGDGTVLYSLGKELGADANTVSVDNLQIRRYYNPRDNTYGAINSYTQNTNTFYKLDGQLLVGFKKGRAAKTEEEIKKSSTGAAVLVRRIAMQLIINDAGVIQTCFSTADEFLDNACENLGGIVDGVDGTCRDVLLRTRTDSPATNNSYAATIGDNFSASISDRNGLNAPLKVQTGAATSYMTLDQDTIQTRQGSSATPFLQLNPFGRVEISGATGYGDISNANPTTAALKVMGAGNSYLAFDSNEIQATNSGSATSLMLNPYGSYVMIGQSGQTSHFRVYGNIQVGDPGSPVTTRQITMYDGSYINFLSDESVKDEVAVLDGVLDKLDEIRGVSFVWKDTGRKDIGYIAQDLEKVFPEVVERDEATGLLNVQYTKMPAINTAAIKELRAENQELKFRVNLLMKALCEGEDAYKYEDVCALPLAPLE